VQDRGHFCSWRQSGRIGVPARFADSKYSGLDEWFRGPGRAGRGARCLAAIRDTTGLRDSRASVGTRFLDFPLRGRCARQKPNLYGAALPGPQPPARECCLAAQLLVEKLMFSRLVNSVALVMVVTELPTSQT
jgi:hypothetical protein